MGKDRMFSGKMHPNDIGYGEAFSENDIGDLRGTVKNAREYLLRHLEDRDNWKHLDLGAIVGAMVGDRDRYKHQAGEERAENASRVATMYVTIEVYRTALEAIADTDTSRASIWLRDIAANALRKAQGL